MLYKRFTHSTQILFYTVTTIFLFVVLSLLLQSVGSAWGANLWQPASTTPSVPPLMNYNGILRDPEGKPMSGAFKMTFRIYQDVTAPTTNAAWTEVHEAVTVREGTFNALLGNNTPLSPMLFASSDLFVGVQVEPFDEMVPRQRFASVPYAAHADYANGLQKAGGQVVDALFVNESGQLVTTQHITISSGATISGTIAIESSSALAINANSAQNVGIGTNSPQANLQVNGNKVRVQGAADVLDLNTTYPNGAGMEANRTLYMWSGDYLQMFSGNNGGASDVLINPNNNAKRVGIGMYGPQATLDVNGSANVRGPLTVNQVAPVRIIRFENVGNDADFDTGISELEYSCVVAGWAATWADKETNGNPSAGVNMVWSYAKLSTWWVKVSFHSGNDDENPDIDLLCFRNEISSWEGAPKDLNDPN